MDENIDLNQELQKKNQEMLSNKKKVDLDTSMESLLVFFGNYCNNISSEINNRICEYHGISADSEKGKIFHNTITSFLFIANKELENIIKKTLDKIKEKLDSLDDKEYALLLNRASIVIINELTDYYATNINMLSSELNQDVSEEVKNKIDKFLFDFITIRIINVLKDKFMYTITVIGNNFEENKEIIDTINEKTIQKN